MAFNYSNSEILKICIKNRDEPTFAQFVMKEKYSANFRTNMSEIYRYNGANTTKIKKG
jgi:hypothetical protein